jgi:acetyl-CoA carboxylase biotin carboxyl carrier protein
MEIKDIITLIRAVSESNLSEFEYKEGETKLSFHINREMTAQGELVVQVRPQVSAMETRLDAEPDNCNIITSPMVGTFYSASSEEGKPFIEVGDTIKKGQVIGIVEAMKLMNEIESIYDGVVEEILVSNREMVGFEQMLVRVRPL